MNIVNLVLKKLFPGKHDVGMHSLDQKAGVHVHDSGSVEIYAGSTCMLLDGESNTITMRTKNLNQVADKINLRMSPAGLTVPHGRLNPKLLPDAGDSMSDYRRELDAVRSMLSPKNLAVMSTYGVKNVQATNANMYETPAQPLSSVFNLITPIQAVNQKTELDRVLTKLKQDIPKL